MPTYPSTPQLTIDALLKQPKRISRDLTNLVRKRLIADRIFLRGSAESVAGGGAQYQRSESIYLDRDVEEIATRAGFPRAGWTEELRTAMVKTYGLEVPINDLTVRRHQQDQVARAFVKLANQIVKFIDGKAMTLLTTDTDVQTFAASGDWSTAATDIVSDLAEALRLIDVQDEGYEGARLILNPAQFKDLLVDKDIRDAMPRETRDTAIQTGRVSGILGFGEILRTNALTAGTVLVLDSMVGTIADEEPDPQEGYQAYAPQDPAQRPVQVKVYREENSSDTIVRGARWPAMWIAEPKAAVKITSA